MDMKGENGIFIYIKKQSWNILINDFAYNFLLYNDSAELTILKALNKLPPLILPTSSQDT